MLNVLGSMGLFVASSNQEELNGRLPADYQWRMADFQKHLGKKKLQTIEEVLGYRQQLSKLYDEGLQSAGWPTTKHCKGTLLLRYPLRVANKQALLERARAKRIELGSWFESPLHPVPFDQHSTFGYEQGICPLAERASQEVVNLPLHEKVTPTEADRILRFFLKHAQKK